MYSEALCISPHAKNATGPAVVRGAGCYLYDPAGAAFLDMTGGSGAVNLGHQRPEVVETVLAQAGQLMHTGWNIDNPFRHGMIAGLARIAPYREAAVMGAVTGAEGIEVALKIARAATGRATVLHFSNSFHGKTQGALSVTDNAGFRSHLVAGSAATERFDLSPCYGADDAGCARWAEGLAQRLADLRSTGALPAAMIVEPVQGAEGIHVIPVPALRAILEIGRSCGVITIFDEIYTGFGRIGRPFAASPDLLPDLLVIGKSMGNGLPVAAVLGAPSLVNVLGYAAHSSTFTFSPLACAVAERVIGLHLEEQPWRNALRMETRLRDELAALSRADDRICNIRGAGLMLAFDFSDPTLDVPDLAGAELGLRLEQAGVIVRTGGQRRSTVKLTPPLIFSERELDHFLDRLRLAMTRVGASLRPRSPARAD